MLRSRFVDILIIGAGPTGLGAACHLNENGNEEWLLIDAAGRPGGMATTETDDHGFLWDLGGHVIHSHCPAFDRAMAQHPNWVYPRRGGWVRVSDIWCPTPIQRNLGWLHEESQIIAELSKISSDSQAQVDNLEDHYATTFGTTLNKLFFAPFNSKQWGGPLNALSHTWTSLRSGSEAQNVPPPSLSSNKAPEATPDDTSTFPYPTLGSGALWQTISENLPAARQFYRTTITSIDLDKQVAHLDSGIAVHFGRCLSTIPLTSLLNLTRHQRPDLAFAIDRLLYISTILMGFGFIGPLPSILAGKTWIFSADPAVPFHRATVPTNFSKSLPGPGRWSILFEISVSRMRKLNNSELIAAHLNEVSKWGINSEPISIWQQHLEFGYPLPFLGRDELLKRILPELEKCNIFPRGRFGGWRYESSNQDYAFAQGVEAAEFFLTRHPETTYWPDRYLHVE